MPLPIAVLAQDYLPHDVQRFVDRREGCDQMRRVASDSKEKLLKLCMGTDKEFAQLKRKYMSNSTIMQILNQFEVNIELTEFCSTKESKNKIRFKE